LRNVLPAGNEDVLRPDKQTNQCCCVCRSGFWQKTTKWNTVKCVCRCRTLIKAVSYAYSDVHHRTHNRSVHQRLSVIITNNSAATCFSNHDQRDGQTNEDRYVTLRGIITTSCVPSSQSIWCSKYT